MQGVAVACSEQWQQLHKTVATFFLFFLHTENTQSFKPQRPWYTWRTGWRAATKLREGGVILLHKEALETDELKAAGPVSLKLDYSKVVNKAE